MEAHEDDYDIVYDRMADKRYPDLTNAIEAFYFGEKEATEVVQMIRRKKEADQYCFKNERALSLLEREEVWIQKWMIMAAGHRKEVKLIDERAKKTAGVYFGRHCRM